MYVDVLLWVNLHSVKAEWITVTVCDSCLFLGAWLLGRQLAQRLPSWLIGETTSQTYACDSELIGQWLGTCTQTHTLLTPVRREWSEPACRSWRTPLSAWRQWTDKKWEADRESGLSPQFPLHVDSHSFGFPLLPFHKDGGNVLVYQDLTPLSFSQFLIAWRFWPRLLPRVKGRLQRCMNAKSRWSSSAETCNYLSARLHKFLSVYYIFTHNLLLPVSGCDFLVLFLLHCWQSITWGKMRLCQIVQRSI